MGKRRTTKSRGLDRSKISKIIMATKKHTLNRCRVEGCKKVISAKFLFCYEHKNRIRDLQADVKIHMKRYYCDGCGTVSHGMFTPNCQYCGKEIEEA